MIEHDTLAGPAADPVDDVLIRAGATWRDGQQAPRPVAASLFVAGPGRRVGFGFGARTWSFFAGVGVALAIVMVAAALSPGWFVRFSAAGPGASPTSGAIGSNLAHCPITKPTKPFHPPIDAQLPETMAWYGNGILWTWLDRDGEVWEGLPRTETGLTQKTFWWSSAFDVHREQQPEIYVIGSRIGPPGQFGSGPGTNASGDFGSAMLVGIDIPEEGCWNVTAHYRGTSLNYVVWVGPPG